MIWLWAVIALVLIAWAWLVGWLAGQARGRTDMLWEIDQERRGPQPSREIDPW